MLSLNQAIEIKESILAYLKATFTFQDKEVHKAFYEFVNDPNNGLFKGPYLSLKLPFVKAKEEDQESIPLTIKPDWLPYDHQVKSWHRLSTQHQTPKPSIITTGTGSGKTESFMYPILDYSYRNLSRPGIKVIILYPMNALATDQAKRLAEAIYEDKRLRGKVTAGLFIGEGKDAKKYPKTMGESHVIENKESILASPPDILLTNFKMLDYGLMKSNYNDLWLGNYQDNTVLQFLVLDELHTYDGAQGTDVANLIRRLKLKLSIPENHLCPVGTSATIGSGEEAPQLLSDYASKIFGETIDTDCLITENRLSTENYFGSSGTLEPFTPRPQILKEVKPITGEGYHQYIDRQISFWQCNKEELDQDLLRLSIVKDLVEVTNKREGIRTLKEIIKDLSSENNEFRKMPQWDAIHEFNPKEALVLSLFALIAEAKVKDPKNGRKSPFLYVQAQLWIRELSGVLREVNETPKFTWKEAVDQEENGDLALPPWFCRECGASGWLGVKHDNKERFEKDIQDVYSKYFENHKNIYFANRTSWFSQIDAANAGYEATDLFHKQISNKSLELFKSKEDDRTDITAFRKLNEKGRNDHVCPECNTRNTVSIIGTRIATLSSIAVSQTLSTDLEKQEEKERKVLAFTNSVQDAAHQAGFYESRNYRFTFRSSLQKVINQLEKPVSLTELSEHFIEYWKKNSIEGDKELLDAYYYRFFPADYIGKSSPRDYSDNGRYDPHFQKEFDIRMSWEIYSEFGYNALIGRTLEKTKSSAVSFPLEALKETWQLLAPWLQENEPSKTIKEEEFLIFLNLILHRMRTRGAINHTLLDKFRARDLKLWDLNWNKDNRHFLQKKFSTRSRLPKLITFNKDTRKGILDTTYARTSNWFHQYYNQCFPMASPHVDIKNEFFEEIIKALHSLGVFEKSNEEEKLNYALNPHKIYVTKEVKTYSCNKCGHEVYVSEDNLDLTEGTCLNHRCTGKYEQVIEASTSANNYYQLVYNRNKSPRVYAADHTGLLERKQRELLEEDFKKRPRFNSKNAMVATSTLEMGIDIGDLNTAFNNTIPPLPSNFLQRVGRAGRSSGSALVVNFSKNQAHDLFYYGEPMDMMSGEVSTPGCYIEAKEILKRHFFAFCIDTWTKRNAKEHNIPVNIKYLRLETTDLLSPDFFMNKILNFIKVNEDQLFNHFREGYKNDIGASVFENLRYELNNDSFYQFHKQIFIKLKDEIAAIQQIKKEINERIKELKLGKEDPERIELEKEKKNLGGIIMAMKKRATLEHLTNVGALPNYAFPETGVTLQAKVLGNRAIASNKPPLDKDFEIVRSSSQAIREFAPDNLFYSQGYKFQITGINTFDWSDSNNFHKKRFCSNCDHIEIAETAPKGNCPKCGHESWNASSNVHTYAKLVSVKSFNNQADATIKDSSEDRDSIIYQVQTHFNFKDATSYGAYAMKEIPFGIEFVKDVSLLEGNLGRADVANARKIKINETEVPAHGFVTCKHCGKSSSNIRQKDYKYHYGYCKHKDRVYEGSADDVFEEVFFFREIKTEALKILLPVQEFNSEAEIKMFKAGIELGLKRYFKGNPQHLRLVDYSEYNYTTSKFDKYLVLYDSIPGGTSYLEKLLDASEFSILLRNAYSEIKNCSCQLEGKDGCYRCIYSYSNQYYQVELSRALAEKRFAEIVKRCDDWEAHHNGLGNITNQGNIEESELEERFIRSLKKLAKLNTEWNFSEVNDDGVISYTLQYEDENKQFTYHIRPQVNLGKNDGIEFNTRTDFLMICTEFIRNNKPVEDLYAIPRIAIYLDGYQFHASKEHNRFLNDLEKRKSIARSNNHISWTLTWNDVELFDGGLEDKDQKTLPDNMGERIHSQEFTKTRTALLKGIKKDLVFLNKYNNNFYRLIDSLENLDRLPFIQKNITSWLGLFHRKLFTPSYAPEDLEEALSQNAQDNYCKRAKTLDGLIPVIPIKDNTLCKPNIAVNIKHSKVYYKWNTISDTEIEKESWNVFWQVFNLLQFFEEEKEQEKAAAIMEFNETEELSLEEILEHFDSDYHKILAKMFEKGMIKTEEDEKNLYSLVNEAGDSIAEAYFIIHTAKQFIDPSSIQDKSTLEKNGYTEIDVAALENIEI